MKFTKSNKYFSSAKKLMPGGVNSPVRAFKSVGGDPLFMESGKGSKMHDVDGNEYIDYVASWGPLILGHSYPSIVKAINAAAEKGTSFGTCTYPEVKLAQLIIDAIPSIQKIRLVNSGTEAVMSAIRLARAYAGKNKIIKFDGCYHGHYDNLLVKAGSGLATFGIPSSRGISSESARNTISLPYNDIPAVERALEKHGEDIAAIILEPVAANMGIVLPAENYLSDLSKLCKAHQILLIFDEVITGFRLCYGGIQNIYKIKPDLTILGKIIGGGLPVGAYGGRKDIMSLVAPEGDVYQAGTLSGNPVAMEAGIAVLSVLKHKHYLVINNLTAQLTSAMSDIFAAHAINVFINQIGSMFTCFFLEECPRNFDDVKKADSDRYAAFFRSLIRNGIYFPPSQFEACFLSFAHTKKDVMKTINAVEKAALKFK